MEKNGRSVIIHGESPLKGRERRNHKYLAREWKNGKWYYKYTNSSKSLTSQHTVSGQMDTSRRGQEYNSGGGVNFEDDWYNKAMKRKKEEKKKQRLQKIRERWERGKSFIEKFFKRKSSISTSHDVRYGK